MGDLNDYARRFFSGELRKPRPRRQTQPRHFDLRGVPLAYLTPDERAFHGIREPEPKPEEPEEPEPPYGVRLHPPPPLPQPQYRQR